MSTATICDICRKPVSETSIRSGQDPKRGISGTVDFKGKYESKIHFQLDFISDDVKLDLCTICLKRIDAEVREALTKIVKEVIEGELAK